MGIFKAYDIRGTYPDELNEATAERIGTAFANLVQAKKVVVGHDMRVSAPAISRAFIKGVCAAGADVVTIGLCDTPQISFAVGKYGYDGGAMITASHNPSQYIGMKCCRKEAQPISYDTGINEIERRVSEGDLEYRDTPGSVTETDITEDYKNHVVQFAGAIKPLTIVVDAGNGMGGKIIPEICDSLPCAIIPLFFELDGRFPNHEANPLKLENMKDLITRVQKETVDLGVAFDGDADRIAFVDETGAVVTCDMITALIAPVFLEKERGAAIIYDLRSSWTVPEEVEKRGGKPVECRVGHSFMKAKLREHNAPFGGELSGHYYFRDNFFADSGIIAFITVLNLLSKSDKSLSQLVSSVKRYYATGEINFDVKDKKAKVRELEQVFSDGRISHLDGITVAYSDWWFNVRASNTEPVLRLNLEAKTREQMLEKRAQVEKVIKRT